MKQEHLYGIFWSVKYPGVKTNILEINANGEKTIHTNSLVQVDEEKSEEKVVNLRILDGQEERIAVCCEVKVLKDSGYGSMKPLRKEKCEDLTVSTVGEEPLSVELKTSHTQVVIGDILGIVCKSSNPAADLLIRVNSEEINVLKRDDEVEARVNILEEHFTPVRRSIGYRPQGNNIVTNGIIVECLGKYGSHIAANSSTMIQRSLSQGSSPSNSGSHVERNSRTYWNERGKGQNHELSSHNYMLVESSRFNQGSVIKGEIDEDILENISFPTKTAENRIETSDDVVRVLNILGSHGYRVVGVGNSMDNRMVWTIERKYIEDEL